MNGLHHDYMQMSHYPDLLKEAQNERLARLVAPSEPVLRKLAGKAFLWLGARSTELGYKFQPRPVINRESIANEGCA